MKNVKQRRKLKSLIESLVRETVVLKEDDGEGSIVHKIFIEPFTDIAKTAMHGIQKVGVVTTGNLNKFAKMAGVAILPFISNSEMKRLGQEEEAKIQNALNTIDSKYADVLSRNIDTLRTRDVALLSFVMDPTTYLGSEAVKRAPQVALGILEMLTGGDEKVRRLKEKFIELNKKVMPPTSSVASAAGAMAGYDYFGGEEGFGESKKVIRISNKFLFEQKPNVPYTKEDLNNKVATLVTKLLSDPTIKQKLADSPISNTLQNSAIDVVLERAKKVSRMKTYDELKKYVGKDFDKFEAQIKNSLADLSPEEQERLKQAQVPEIKKAYRQIYSHYLKSVYQKNPQLKNQINQALGELSKLL